jgi:hypothetical protein
MCTRLGLTLSLSLSHKHTHPALVVVYEREYIGREPTTVCDFKLLIIYKRNDLRFLNSDAQTRTLFGPEFCMKL